MDWAYHNSQYTSLSPTLLRAGPIIACHETVSAQVRNGLDAVGRPVGCNNMREAHHLYAPLP
jgi:hypothetical protein